MAGINKDMINLVEILEDGLCNQKCKYGYLIPGHSVYCHSDNPEAPRKCRHTWYYGKDDIGKQDQDCPFYEPNLNYNE